MLLPLPRPPSGRFAFSVEPPARNPCSDSRLSGCSVPRPLVPTYACARTRVLDSGSSRADAVRCPLLTAAEILAAGRQAVGRSAGPPVHRSARSAGPRRSARSAGRPVRGSGGAGGSEGPVSVRRSRYGHAAGPARRAVGVRRNPCRQTNSACGGSAFFAARRASWLCPLQLVRALSPLRGCTRRPPSCRSAIPAGPNAYRVREQRGCDDGDWELHTERATLAHGRRLSSLKTMTYKNLP